MRSGRALVPRISLKYFARYFDSYYGPYNRRVFCNTLVMGVLTAIGGTVLGFIFAYTMVRCSMPFKRLIHILALVPTVSPPFALALSSILLFGRNGLVSHKLLGIEFPPGVNDIYGLDGLVFVQVITFFSVAYLIVRAMLERLDPSMEEAAHSLGAGKLHIFRTVTLPLLIPGIAGALPAALRRVAGRPGQPALHLRQRHGALGADLPGRGRRIRLPEGVGVGLCAADSHLWSFSWCSATMSPAAPTCR